MTQKYQLVESFFFFKLVKYFKDLRYKSLKPKSGHGQILQPWRAETELPLVQDQSRIVRPRPAWNTERDHLKSTWTNKWRQEMLKLNIGLFCSLAYLCLSISVLGTKLRALHLPGQHSATELGPQHHFICEARNFSHIFFLTFSKNPTELNTERKKPHNCFVYVSFKKIGVCVILL